MSKFLNLQTPSILFGKAATTSANATKIIISTATFVDDDEVKVGDIVYNVTDPEYSVITAIDSNTTLTTGSAFSSGDNFVILSATKMQDNIFNLSKFNFITTETDGHGEVYIDVNQRAGTTTQSDLRIHTQTTSTSNASRNELLKSFMSSVSNCLQKSYRPAERKQLPPPIGTKYMYIEVK